MAISRRMRCGLPGELCHVEKGHYPGQLNQPEPIHKPKTFLNRKIEILSQTCTVV